jgi:hypothetical protein
MATEFKINLVKAKTAVQVVKEKIGPIGTWHVTTDGDCEGRSTRQLGTYTGHIALIAFMLSNKACYQLYFSPSELENSVVIKNEIDTVKSEVHVSFAFATSHPELHSINSRIFQEWLGLDFITVTESNYYKTFKLTLKQ